MLSSLTISNDLRIAKYAYDIDPTLVFLHTEIFQKVFWKDAKDFLVILLILLRFKSFYILFDIGLLKRLYITNNLQLQGLTRFL